MSLPSTVVSTSSSSSSFAAAQSADTLLVRDVDGQYRVASSEEVLLQAWGVLAARVKPGAAMTSPQAVKDYLRLQIGLLEYEVFCVVFLDPDGHPNSPTCGHLKLPHPERGVTMG